MMAACLRYSNNRAEAEDSIQEGFMKVFDNMSTFKFNGSLEGWIRRIMVNISLNKVRARRQIFESIDEKFDIGTDASENAYEKLTGDDILKLVSLLPDGYRIVFNMFAIEGFTHAEIANKLGIGEATSRSQYAKAKKYLQNLISKTETVRI